MRTLLTAMAAALLATSAYGNILVNGSFETPIIPVGTFSSFGVGSTGITGWTVTGTSGSIALVNDQFVCCGINYNAADGHQSVDLTGTDDNGGSKGVSQTVILVPGVYMLTYAVGNYSDPNGGGSPFPSTIEVYLDNVLAQTSTNTNNTTGQVNWENFSLIFGTPGGPVSIELRGQGTPSADNYTGLDGVNLDASPIPEPASFFAFGGGLLAIAAKLRKRK